MVLFTSPHGSLALPKDRTICDDLEKNAREIPDKPFLICGKTDRILTYKEVFEKVCLTVAGLHHDGVRKGDVVVLLSVNCVEYAIIFFALNRLGAIYSPSFPQFSSREIAGMMINTKAKRLIAHTSLLELAIDSATKAGLTIDKLLSIGEIRPELPVKAIQEYFERPLEPILLPRIDPDTVVALPFSSGTGSRPKGVVLTARALYAAAMLNAANEERHPVILGLLPFYHISPLMLLHIAAQLGIAMLVMHDFEPDAFLTSICKYQVEKLSVVPGMVDFFAYHPSVAKYDLSFVRYMLSAGAPQSRDAALRVQERLGIEVQQGYGMTEFAGGVTSAENGNVRLGSVGRLLPNVEMKVVALDTQEELGVNRKGELWFRSPQLMQGYWNDAAATNATLTPDGFLRTGDLGYIDDDGFVFIIDRIKSLIKYMGYHVSASELEELLVRHPMVSEACVVRGFDETGEEIPKAYVVLKKNGEQTPPSREDLMLFIAAKVAPYKRIRELEFLPSLPKNPAGKIHRRKLQTRANMKRHDLVPPPMLSRI